MRRIVSRGASVLGLAAAVGLASSTARAEQVKPAAERTIAVGPTSKPHGTQNTGSSGPGSRPAVRGPKIPEALRAQMKAQLDARVDHDFTTIHGLRDEAIGLLTTFVSETPRGSHEMPEALMRLGELKWEVEREAFTDRFKQWDSAPASTRGPTPSPNYEVPRELFGRVLTDYTWFPEYDLALYVDGFFATEQGKSDEALERFNRILRDFPNSRFTPDAHMAKAEAIFNGKYDYAAALVEYEEVMKFQGSDLYGLALFKSAWCYWRLGNNDEAAKRFVKVFEVTDTQGRVVSAQQRKALDELQGEALKYLVEVFTEDETHTAQGLFTFLQKIGVDRFASKIVKALAETYFDQSHYERGIEAYELLLKLEPTSPAAGAWVMQIAAGYAALEDYPKLKATYERAIKEYTPGGPWSRTQADPANIATTNARIEEQLRTHAGQLHAKAQRDKTSRAEFDGAAGLYAVYLSKFGNGESAYQIHFYLAEIDFFRLDKDSDAATHYMAAARLMPKNATGAAGGELATLRHDAIYNAIAALERLRVSELEARKGKPGSGTETETDKKFAEALELYAQLYPNDPALPELFFRQGKLYYDYGVYDSAVKIFGNLLERFPTSPFDADAGELILDSLNRAKNYENIETWARKLKSVQSFQGAKPQERLDTLIVQAVFKQGEQKSAANDHVGAASSYLRAAKEFPHDGRATQACVNAELEAQKSGDVKTLKEAAGLTMGTDYASRPESPQGGWIAASTFQSMGLLSEAAEFDEAMVNLDDSGHPNYQKYEHMKDAAYNAVVLREATGDHDKAVLDGQKFLAVYARAPEADEVFFQMGKAHQNAGRAKDAADLYRQYVGHAQNQDHRVQGYVFLAIAEIKLGDDSGASYALQTAVDLGKSMRASLGADGRYAAAHARYMQGERVLAKFEQIQIQGDVKQLATRLKQKAALLKSASDIFLDTVSLGVAEWATAALYQIGYTTESFGKSLRATQPPANLSEDDKAGFQGQLEEFAVQMEEKSLDAYENGWKKAIELGIYNQWTAKMREALGRLNTELYPPLKEIGFEVRSQGATPFPPLIETPRRGVAK